MFPDAGQIGEPEQRALVGSAGGFPWLGLADRFLEPRHEEQIGSVHPR